MQLLDPDLIWPMAGAIVAGAIIGAEREYRASPAGLRTHILVALSCCLLMLSAVHQMEWLNDAPAEVIRIDPVRMAHGILTGVGFLCGGVIFRERLNVRGLTTAASLWMTSTLGILFGIGFHELAVFGAVTTVLVLAAVGFTERHAPQRRVVHISARYDRRTGVGVADFRKLLDDHGMKAITVEEQLDRDVLTFSAIANDYEEERARALVAAWSQDASLRGYEVRPQQP
ncbi:MAG: MgtC/SapB family protein [Sphingopyxis sp.]